MGEKEKKGGIVSKRRWKCSKGRTGVNGRVRGTKRPGKEARGSGPDNEFQETKGKETNYSGQAKLTSSDPHVRRVRRNQEGQKKTGVTE